MFIKHSLQTLRSSLEIFLICSLKALSTTRKIRHALIFYHIYRQTKVVIDFCTERSQGIFTFHLIITEIVQTGTAMMNVLVHYTYVCVS